MHLAALDPLDEVPHALLALDLEDPLLHALELAELFGEDVAVKVE